MPVRKRTAKIAPPLVAATMMILAATSSQPAAARTISSTGTLQPVSTVTLGSQVSGMVTSVTCDFNSVVKKGQVCARIDPRTFQKAVEQARANLASAKALLAQHQASLTYAKATLDRNTILLQRGVVSKDLFESLQSTYGQVSAQLDVDRAAIAQSQAEVDVAELNLGYTDIASPVDGVVLTRKVSVGETLAANFQIPSLFIIASDLSRLHLISSVGEAEVGALRQGDAATFTVKAFSSRTFPAKVVQIRSGPDTQRSDVGYVVVLEVDNADQQLKPGMTASVRFSAGD